MKSFLMFLIISLILFSVANSLFTDTPTHNFTISGFNGTDPTAVVDGAGTKFLLWNKYPSQVQLYTINGTLLCSFTFGMLIERIIWPSNFSPLIVSSVGTNVATVNESTCAITKYYNIQKITNLPNDKFYFQTFNWINSVPILTVSGLQVVYAIDLTSQKVVNSYRASNQTITSAIQQLSYSNDLNYLYVVATDYEDTNKIKIVRIYDTKKQNENPLKVVKLPNETQIATIAPARDGTSVVFYGLSMDDFSTVIFTLDSAGSLLKRITKTVWRFVLLITDTKLFDSAAFFNHELQFIELLKIMDGKSLQTISLPEMQSIKATDYKNKTMIILLNSSQILTYCYEPDQNINPDNGGKEDNSSPVVWIVVGVVLGVIVIGVAAFFIIKKKNLFRKQEEAYGKIQDLA